MSSESRITKTNLSDINLIIKSYNNLKMLPAILESGLSDQRVSIGMFIILQNIDAAGNQRLTTQDVAEEQSITESAISRKVGTLLELGYMDQIVDKKDRRKKYLVMTPKGKRFYTKSKKIFEAMLDDIYEKFGTDDFMETLNRSNEIFNTIKQSLLREG